MQTKLFTVGLLFAISLFVVACDDDSSSNNNTNNVNNANNVNNVNNVINPEICDDTVDNDLDGDTDCVDTDCAEDPACAVDAREAFELTISLHDTGVQKMNLRDKIAGGDLASCDFGFLDDEVNGPRILLCPDTTGYNHGNETDFYDVTAAPTDVTYETDGDGTYVIGSSWVSGGTCAAGWECNGNIYILHLQDDSYAKIEVVYGLGGTVTVLAFRDVAGGSDLTCEPLPE